ncbi:lytic transglycosylase domain-containing protein [Leptospira sp. 96542]|nr:lytic transglycosylase domain-containing protein [Leptospira sp. 96542]
MRLTDIPSLSQVISRIETISGMAGTPKNAKPESEFAQILETGLMAKETTANSPTKPANELSNLTSQVPTKQDGIISKIESIASAEGLDPNLVKAIVKAESGFKPKAVSPKGAMGLMQLMPKTAESLGVENPFDPEENISGGVRFLKGLLTEFQNPEKAIAAYNAGPGAVKRYKGVPPYEETQNYVTKVKKYYKDFSS